MNQSAFISGLVDGLKERTTVTKEHFKSAGVAAAARRAFKWLDLGGRRNKFEQIQSKAKAGFISAREEAKDFKNALMAAKHNVPFRQEAPEGQVMLPASVVNFKSGYRPKDAPLPFVSLKDPAVERGEARFERLNLLGKKLDKAKSNRRLALGLTAGAVPLVGGAVLYGLLRQRKPKKGKKK